MKKTQTEDVLKYLKTHKKGITSMEAIQLFGATRLSDIVYRLVHRGIKIVSEPVEVKTRYGRTVYISRYKLVD